MREDCADLTQATIAAGHLLMLEQPDEVNRVLANWIAAKRLASLQ